MQYMVIRQQLESQPQQNHSLYLLGQHRKILLMYQTKSNRQINPLLVNNLVFLPASQVHDATCVIDCNLNTY